MNAKHGILLFLAGLVISLLCCISGRTERVEPPKTEIRMEKQVFVKEFKNGINVGFAP